MIRKSTTWFALSWMTLVAVSGAQDAAPPAPAPAVNFTIVDARAEADKKQKILSLMLTSCNYGIYRLGEKRAPARFEALRDDLLGLKGEALRDKTLTVSRYNIYFNNSLALRGMMNMQFDGLFVDMLNERGMNCAHETIRDGWYSGSEVTGTNAPIIIDLEATLDGVAHQVRVVHSMAAQSMGAFKYPEEIADLAAARRKVAEALAAQLP